MYRNSDIEKQLRNRYKGHMNRENGAFFEYIIEAGCEYYRQKGVADIEKTPEPMRPVKNIGEGKFIAYFEKAAQPDFKGVLSGGRAVVFEAKHTDTDQIEQKRVSAEQVKNLEMAWKLGAETFVLCSISDGFYRLPWEFWRDMKSVLGRKYVTADDLRPYKIDIGGPGALLFLEGIIK